MNLFNILRPKGDIVYLRDDCTIRQALEKMKAHGYTALPVIDRKGQYVGSISEGDFLWNIVQHGDGALRELERHLLREIIRPDWMLSASIYISRDELLNRALNQNYIPIVDDRNIFIGIITRRDIISWFTAFQEISVEKEAAVLC